MPNTDAVGKVASSLFLESLRQNNIWMGLADDRSSELAYGDTIELPTDETAYAVNTASVANGLSSTASDHAWGTPLPVTLNSVNLVVNKGFDIDVLVGLLVQEMVRPSTLQQAVDSAARTLREQRNAEMRGALDLAVSDNQLTAITTKTAEWGNAAHATAVDKSFSEASVKAGYRHWGVGMGRVAVMSPATYEVLENKILTDKNYFAGDTNDQLLRENALGRYKGFTLMVDDSLAEGTAQGDGAKHTIYFVLRGQSFAFAQSLNNFRFFQSEQYKGYRIQGIQYYGAVIHRPSRSMIAKTTITA